VFISAHSWLSLFFVEISEGDAILQASFSVKYPEVATFRRMGLSFELGPFRPAAETIRGGLLYRRIGGLAALRCLAGSG
jgi:hypothetical protein